MTLIRGRGRRPCHIGDPDAPSERYDPKCTRRRCHTVLPTSTGWAAGRCLVINTLHWSSPAAR